MMLKYRLSTVALTPVLLLIALFGGLAIAYAQNSPIQLRAPWDDSDWWQPSTYLPDHSGTGLHTATDFNYVSAGSVSTNWPYASELQDQGRNIRAACSGTVQQTLEANSGGYGNEVVITSSENSHYKTRYGHLADFAGVANGANVNAGDVIGHCGNTGHVTGPHLHFELLLNGVRQNLDGIILSGQPVSIDFSRLQFPGTANERYIGYPIQSRSSGSDTDIYVSLNGSDTSNGSSGSPFRSVAHAIDRASATLPVTIHIAPGTYGEKIGASKHIQFVTWGAGTVRIGG